MKTNINLPGFTAEVNIQQSRDTSYVGFLGFATNSSSTIQPQFRSQVRNQCGPCRNHKSQCVTWGYECTVVPGVPGSEHLGIPGSPGHVRCEPEIFREWERSC